MKEKFKKYFLKAMKILDALNELMTDIDWDKENSGEFGEPLEEGEEELLTTLYYGIEDTEAMLSDNLYDSGLYKEYEDLENERHK